MTTTIESVTSARTANSTASSTTPPFSFMRPVVLPGDTVASGDGRYTLKYQTDGNLVLYVQTGSDPVAIWASKTAGKSVGSAVMQGDGNFVIYGKDGKSAVWSSGTSGHPGSWLLLRRDGNVVICSPDGTPPWNPWDHSGADYLVRPALDKLAMDCPRYPPGSVLFGRPLPQPGS